MPLGSIFVWPLPHIRSSTVALLGNYSPGNIALRFTEEYNPIYHDEVFNQLAGDTGFKCNNKSEVLPMLEKVWKATS